MPASRRHLRAVVRARARLRPQRTSGVRALAFDVEPGEALLVQGDNGAGKTTLLRVLADCCAPTPAAWTSPGTRPTIARAAATSPTSATCRRSRPIFSAGTEPALPVRSHGARPGAASATRSAAGRPVTTMRWRGSCRPGRRSACRWRGCGCRRRRVAARRALRQPRPDGIALVNALVGAPRRRRRDAGDHPRRLCRAAGAHVNAAAGAAAVRLACSRATAKAWASLHDFFDGTRRCQ